MSYPFRLLLLILTLPFHAFLGVTIMGQTELIGGDWYPSLHDTLPWLPDPHDDQHLAGGILWGSGDLIALLLFVGAVRPVGARLDGRGATRGPAARPAGASLAEGSPATRPDPQRAPNPWQHSTSGGDTPANR